MIYTIKDVSNITGLSIYNIRYYDKEELMPFVSRNDSGIRLFTESDINQIKTICCLKDTGMPMKEIKQHTHFCMEGSKSIDSRKELLLEHREIVKGQIEVLHDNLKEIDLKLAIYTSPYAKQIIETLQSAVKDEKQEHNLEV